MKIQIKTQIGNDLVESKDVIDRIVGENLNKKLDVYLNKFTKQDAEGILDINLEKNKKGLFDGKIQASLDGNQFRSEREDFKNLDDLINHLFDHIKLQLSN